MSFVGVTTLTLSNILGAIVSFEPPVEVSVVVVPVSVVPVSVVPVSVVPVSAVVEELTPPSSLLHEMIVRLKMDIRIMYRAILIFFLHQ